MTLLYTLPTTPSGNTVVIIKPKDRWWTEEIKGGNRIKVKKRTKKFCEKWNRDLICKRLWTTFLKQKKIVTRQKKIVFCWKLNGRQKSSTSQGRQFDVVNFVFVFRITGTGNAVQDWRYAVVAGSAVCGASSCIGSGPLRHVAQSFLKRYTHKKQY